MITVEQFTSHFPEFEDCPPAFLQSYLDDAETCIDRTIWGEDKGDIGQKYLAAHNLALSPFGQQARLIAKGAKTTTYFTRYDEVRRKIASGHRVI